MTSSIQVRAGLGRTNPRLRLLAQNSFSYCTRFPNVFLHLDAALVAVLVCLLSGKSQLLDENDINLTVPANQSLDENDVNIAAPANQSAAFSVNSSASFPTNHVDSSRQLSTNQRLLANNNTLTDDVDDSVMIVEPMRNNDTNHVLVSNNKPVSNMATAGALQSGI